MPAIQPARLRKQVIELVDCFNQPDRFLYHLRDLLELYASHAHRLVQGTAAHTLLPAYEVPPAVIHQVENELYPFCQSEPAAALKLADRLWMDDFLEVRRLAVDILGVVPLSPPEPVSQRLFSWLETIDDPSLRQAILEHVSGKAQGMPSSTGVLPALLWEKAKSWLSSPAAAAQRLGLQALASLVASDRFDDLPAAFPLISPLIYPDRPELRAVLEAVIIALAQRSPAETVYFLKQVLSLSPDPALPRLVRHCLPSFTEPWRSSLQIALRGMT